MSDRAKNSEPVFWGDADHSEALQHFRTLVNTIDDGIYQLDAEDCFVAVNDVLIELTGYAREDLLGEHVSVVLDDSSTIEREIERLRTNPSERGELLDLTVRTAEGEAVRCELRVNLLEADDTVRGTVGTVREITEQNRTDQGGSQREQELEHHETIIDTVTDGVYTLDADSRFTMVNDAFVELVGYSRDELLGAPASLVHSDATDAEASRKVEQIQTDEREVAVMEVDVQTADGAAVPVESRISPFPAPNGATGRVGVVRDVTERKQMEEKLRESEERFRAFVEASSDVVYRMSPDWSEMRRLEGREFIPTTDEPSDSWLDTYIHPDDQPMVTEAIEEAIHNKTTFEMEHRVRRVDGTLGWTLSRAVPILNGDDEIVEWLGTATDITETKERERELEQHERIIESIDDGVYALDDDSNFVMVNDAFCDIVGWEREELLGRHATTIYDDDLEPTVVEEAADVASGDSEPAVLEFSLTTKDDGTVPVEVRFRPFPYGDGDGRCGVVRDVSDRLERERALEESERRYRTLAENFPGGAVAVYDDDLRFTLAQGNKLGETLPGREQVEDRTVSKVFPPDIVEDLDPLLRAAVEYGEAGDDRFEFAGHNWRVWATPLRDADGDIFAGLGLAQDITEQVEREHDLENAKAQLEAAAEAGAVGTWEWHVPEDRFVAGASFARTFGVDPDAARDGVSIERLLSSIHEADRERVGAEIEDTIESCGEIEVEYRVWNDDDELRWVNARGHVECDEDGNPITFPGALTDITERKRFEQQLEASNERLEQFAYAASHDLQEPLRMVSSYLQLVEQRYADELDEDGREFIEFAVDGADRMKEMIEGLLEYSRVDNRGNPFEPVDLNDVLGDAREDLQVTIEESEAEITSEELPPVEGDEGQLRQVFQNLLDNAIEYSGDEPPEVNVSADRNGYGWIVSVRDEGVGIDPDDADRVFEVFQSLHTNDEHVGTGIGLALCERIVERHGGDIWVESEPGDGATVSFTLPADGEHSQ